MKELYMSNKIRVGIIGVGNCAKSLVEAVSYYKGRRNEDTVIGGYSEGDIEFVIAYDVDSRKVGKQLCNAISKLPNCAIDLDKIDANTPVDNVVVKRGRIADGVAEHMKALNDKDEERFYITQEDTIPSYEGDRIVEELIEAKPDVVLIYLPVGSRIATRFYVECLLEAKVPFINCIPEFIVSDPEWAKKIEEAGICAIGDDMRSHVGASVLSQVLQEMLLVRGAKDIEHIQMNIGGNSDFLNMTAAHRLASKKVSKESVITSQGDIYNQSIEQKYTYAGPAAYVPGLGDTKIAHIMIKAKGICNSPIRIDVKLEVEDSPNSAGIVLDAIRYLKIASEMGMKGPLLGISAYTQKHPPEQMTLADSYAACQKLITDYNTFKQIIQQMI